MSLWFLLNVNDQRIGMCEIQRREVLDLSDRDAIADVVSTYTVRIDGVERAEVRHRYGDGAWPLVRAALNTAFPDPGPDHCGDPKPSLFDRPSAAWCVRQPGHEAPHRDLFGAEWTRRESDPHAVLTELVHESEALGLYDLEIKACSCGRTPPCRHCAVTSDDPDHPSLGET